MHINRAILFERLRQFIEEKYRTPGKGLLIDLCRKIIYNDPAQNCILKGPMQDWEGLPRDKSLFYSPIGCGLPIGNLTSQVFANFYMNSFDHFMKHELKLKYYGRYVDDFVVVVQEKEYAKELIPIIRSYLQENLQLTLHPKKIYLQHFAKGVAFLGAFLVPYRIYVNRRTAENFQEAITKWNAMIKKKNHVVKDRCLWLSSMNSYLGMMKQYKTYRLRKKMLSRISPLWRKCAYAAHGLGKINLTS